jgi:hypothetical protein
MALVLIEGYVHVCLQASHLDAQSVPSYIFKNLKVLVLERVTVDSAALADMLSHCHQLEELQLLRTCLLGPSQPLSVLSKLPSLSLTLDVAEPTSKPATTAPQPLACLQDLGPCLVLLDIDQGQQRVAEQSAEVCHCIPTSPTAPDCF